MLVHARTPLVLLLALAAGVSQADVIDPDCECRAPDGQRKRLGTVQCVEITGRSYLVRCEMSNNSPYWRRLLDQAGCPAA